MYVRRDKLSCSRGLTSCSFGGQKKELKTSKHANRKLKRHAQVLTTTIVSTLFFLRTGTTAEVDGKHNRIKEGQKRKMKKENSITHHQEVVPPRKSCPVLPGLVRGCLLPLARPTAAACPTWIVAKVPQDAGTTSAEMERRTSRRGTSLLTRRPKTSDALYALLSYDVGYSMDQLFVAEKNMSHSGAEARGDTSQRFLK